MSARAAYLRHAQRFGVEGVLESAASELDDRELALLAAELRRIDPNAKQPVSPARAVPTAGRTCAAPDCNEPLTGRADRQTCSDRCRKAWERERARQRDAATLPAVAVPGRASGSPHAAASVTTGAQ